MSLRTRCFLLISLLFLVSIAASTLIISIELRKSLERAKGKIDSEIIALDREQQNNILTYLDINAKGMATLLNSALAQVDDIGWLKQRFSPSSYNFETRDWESAGRLLLMHESLDLVTSMNEGSLTSFLALRPPFFTRFLRLPVDDFLSVIVQIEQGKVDCFIGVPFWTNQAIPQELDLSTSKLLSGHRSDTDDWIMFTVEQLLEMDTDLLKHHVVVPEGPLRDEITEAGITVYKQIIESTIEFIRQSKARLVARPKLVEMLKTSGLKEKWVEEQITKLLQKPFSIQKFLKIQQIKQNKITARNWGDRYDQNRMVWELGALTGAGIWDYNPLAPLAPKGIVSLLRGEIVVDGKVRWAKGFLAKNIYLEKPLLIEKGCSPSPTKGEVTTCLAKKLQIFGEDPLDGVYLANTLFFTDWKDITKAPRYGSLTVGINLMPLLQDLALASPDDVLFISKTGKMLHFTSDGQIIRLPSIAKEKAAAMIQEKRGTVKDVDGKEYFFIHLDTLAATGDSVFVVQIRSNALAMLKQLNDYALILIRKVTVQHILISLVALIVTLWFLNQILKRVIRPIRELALATKQIGAGKYDAVTISKEDQARQDEVGLLCRSFDQMVKEMQQAEEVRGILDKVVSKEIAAKILKEGVRLGGEIREVTVLFCDIRHFAKITETMAPELVLDMLNGCLTVISRVIDDHEGVIDKYIGDEVMALFGAPLDTKDAALQAVRCAVDIRAVMLEWNKQRSLRNLCTLPIGIGIHTANVIAGNIGAENHLSYTVLGHGVNLASRVCDEAGEMEIIITKATLEAPKVKDYIKVEPLSFTQLRGLSTPVELFKIL